ncbi:Sugar or nucleoside kinase, ribokinase family [Actinopolyspora lacussalsi subsp. righensis]|uniref:Sugar or nucleoside kinase, ribokinase family n=1 Tax=Actinopolyspora righensis TaxID=995060 RepID=A0A1I7B9W4_9ACTN|nr:PfkB family carbohydrate kinase [Actinopolyspora righensis]SFT83980.1 Sugar or nucleoside kinase, ribokinase family [Actinopolyspora righensis]
MSRRAVLCSGMVTLDLLQRVAEFPGPNEKTTAERAELSAGGPATGAAVTAAALGSEVSLLTALGSHPMAGVVADELAEHGVELLDVTPDSGTPPVVSAVTVHSTTGSRSVVSRAPKDADPEPGALLRTVPDAVLVDGHRPVLARAAMWHAGQAGAPVVLDGGSWKPVLAEILPRVDLAVCSADFRVPGTTELDEQPAALFERGVGAVAITRGPRDVLWWLPDGASGSVPVPEVEAVDTLGAGDVFHGAVVHAVAGGAPLSGLPDTLSFAAGIAADRVRRPGRGEWLRGMSPR